MIAVGFAACIVGRRVGIEQKKWKKEDAPVRVHLLKSGIAQVDKVILERTGYLVETRDSHLKQK